MNEPKPDALARRGDLAKLSEMFEGRFADLERRVSALEPAPETRPAPTPRPPVTTRPPEPRLTPPLLQVVIDGKGYAVTPSEFARGETERVVTYKHGSLDIIFIMERFERPSTTDKAPEYYNAVRTSLIMGLFRPFTPFAVFKSVQIEMFGWGRGLEQTHTIGSEGSPFFCDARRPFIRRILGELVLSDDTSDLDLISTYGYVEEDGELGLNAPEWVRERCEAGEASSMAGSKLLGPWRVGYAAVRGSGSLNGSHGGARLAPYDGGVNGWQGYCKEGLVWAEHDLVTTMMRSPIVMLNDEGKWWNPHEPYWPGRTVQHEPLPYRITTSDGSGNWTWLPLPADAPAYAHELREYRAHDHTHGRRGFGAAGLLAPYDALARWFLVQLAGDTIAWLDGGRSPLGLLQPIEQMLEAPGQFEGDSRGGRGWGHTMALMLEAQPYLPEHMRTLSDGSHVIDAIRTLTLKWASPENGWTHSTGKASFPDPVGGWGAIEDPVCACREIDLVGVNFLSYGLKDLHEAWVRSMAPENVGRGKWRSAPEHMEFRGDAGHWWSVEGRRYNAQPEYDLFRATGLTDAVVKRHGGIDALIETCRTFSPNELVLANMNPNIWMEYAAEKE